MRQKSVTGSSPSERLVKTIRRKPQGKRLAAASACPAGSWQCRFLAFKGAVTFVDHCLRAGIRKKAGIGNTKGKSAGGICARHRRLSCRERTADHDDEDRRKRGELAYEQGSLRPLLTLRQLRLLGHDSAVNQTNR